MNDKYVYYFGAPLFSQTPDPAIEIDLNTQQCKQDSVYYTYDLIYATCLDQKYEAQSKKVSYPTFYGNAYSITKAQEFITAKGITAVVDVKNTVCYVKSFENTCTYSDAVESIAKCACSKTIDGVNHTFNYEFSDEHDLLTLFYYVGRVNKVVLKDELELSRAHPIFDINSYYKVNIGLALADALYIDTDLSDGLTVEGDEAITISAATATAGAYYVVPDSDPAENHYINPGEYKFVSSEWGVEKTKIWFLDMYRGLCYK